MLQEVFFFQRFTMHFHILKYSSYPSVKEFVCFLWTQYLSNMFYHRNYNANLYPIKAVVEVMLWKMLLWGHLLFVLMQLGFSSTRHEPDQSSSTPAFLTGMHASLAWTQKTRVVPDWHSMPTWEIRSPLKRTLQQPAQSEHQIYFRILSPDPQLEWTKTSVIILWVIHQNICAHPIPSLDHLTKYFPRMLYTMTKKTKSHLISWDLWMLREKNTLILNSVQSTLTATSSIKQSSRSCSFCLHLLQASTQDKS